MHIRLEEEERKWSYILIHPELNVDAVGRFGCC